MLLVLMHAGSTILLTQQCLVSMAGYSLELLIAVDHNSRCGSESETETRVFLFVVISSVHDDVLGNPQPTQCSALPVMSSTGNLLAYLVLSFSGWLQNKVTPHTGGSVY